MMDIPITLLSGNESDLGETVTSLHEKFGCYKCGDKTGKCTPHTCYNDPEDCFGPEYPV